MELKEKLKRVTKKHLGKERTVTKNLKKLRVGAGDKIASLNVQIRTQLSVANNHGNEPLESKPFIL